MDRPSASQLHLALACAYPWKPGVRQRQSEGGPEARLGNAFHEFPAAVFNDLPLPAIGDLVTRWNLDTEQGEQLVVMRDALLNHRPLMERRSLYACRAEVAYAYNPSTGLARRLEGQKQHRDYSAAHPGEFVGTCDLEGWPPGPQLCVSDFKTGQPQYVAKPAENAQLRALALMAARVYGVDSVRVELIWVNPHDGGINLETGFLDSFDLAVTEGQLMRLSGDLANPDLRPHPGHHCRRCPAVADCPQTDEALVQTVKVEPPEPYRVVTDMEAIRSPEHATWLLHRYRAVLAAAAVVRQALEGYADAQAGIANGAGGRWARHEIQVDRIKLTAEGRSALEAVLPGAVEWTATKASIDRASREAKLPIKATRESMLARLRELDCVTTSTTVKYEDK